MQDMIEAVIGFIISLVVCSILANVIFVHFAHWLLTSVLAS